MGKVKNAIIELIVCIIRVLKSYYINTIYIFTDGDPSYWYISEMSLDIYMVSFFDGGFDAAFVS